jgi:ribosomal protein S19
MKNRSFWKGFFIDPTLLEQIKYTQKNTFKTSSRASTVLKFAISKIVQVHNGRFFFPFTVTEPMFGHKLGEFIFTRARYIYKKKKKKKK